jgi:hypothetical protein
MARKSPNCRKFAGRDWKIKNDNSGAGRNWTKWLPRLPSKGLTPNLGIYYLPRSSQ